MIEVIEILRLLGKKRPVFHSEADFQHSLAWEIHKELPNADVRLEMPVQIDNHYIHIDIYIVNRDKILALELKYKTCRFATEVNGERYRLKDHSAQDIARYDLIKDIHRLEHLCSRQGKITGYAIFLTNDRTYWTNPLNKSTVDANFRINDGRLLNGILRWGMNASIGTTKDREKPLELNNQYSVHWRDYSLLNQGKNEAFRYLMIKVL